MFRPEGDNDAVGEGAGGQPDRAASDAQLRLLMLTEASESLGSEVELLRLGLQQAMAEVSALGGMAHLVGPEEGALRLAATSGLPARLGWKFDNLGRDEPVATARAVRERRGVWSMVLPGPASDTARLELGFGVYAVPLWSGNDPVGALSFVSREEPGEVERSFIGELAGVVSARLPNVPELRSGVAPWWQEPSGAARRQAMREISVGTWSWDLKTGLLSVDGSGGELIQEAAGLDPKTWDRRIETWMERIDPEDRPGVEAAIEHSFATGHSYAVEYRVRDREGRVSWLELRGHTTYSEDGKPLVMAGTAWDTTSKRGTLEWLRGVLEDLPDPFYVMGPDDRVMYANREGVAITGLSWQDLSGKVLWDVAPNLVENGLPDRFAQARAAQSAVTTKLVVPTATHGDTHYRVRLVPVSSYLAGHLVDITEQERAEQAAAARARQIEALTTALAQTLTVDDVVAATAEHVLPPFGATGLVVHSLSGAQLRLVGSVGYPPEFVKRLEELDDRQRFDPPDQRSARFIGSPEDLEREWPGLAPLARLGGKQAWALLPLVASGHPVGSCVISWDTPQAFRPDESGLLLTIAALVAQAMERARLFDDSRGRAQRLQRALLPGALPPLPGVSAAARYRPASGGRDQVGGDWYDTIPLPGGRVTLVVGDVLGHGLDQAITMGILRNAVLALATLDMAVDELMAHLNDVVTRLGRDEEGATYTTCLVAVYDPTTGLCNLASAGHPPPALVRPGGRTEFLDAIPAGPPLGVAQLPVETLEVELPEGSLLVFYTDGLLGADDRDAGAERLTGVLDQAVAGLPPPGTRREPETAWLEGLCDTITESLRPDPRRPQDDAALLTLRTRRIPRDRIAAWSLPFSPRSAGQARDLVSAQLADWGLAPLADSAELIVSELIGNTVRHAVGPIRLRLVLLDEVLTIEVYDGSEATPHVRHPSFEDEFGRGLQMVALVAEEWGARYTEDGKCIWADQSLPAR